MYLVDTLAISLHRHPVGVVREQFLESAIGLAHFLLELHFLVALISVVRTTLNYLGIRVDVKSQIRFHQTFIRGLAPFKVKTLKYRKLLLNQSH